jgi:hypothetical protein
MKKITLIALLTFIMLGAVPAHAHAAWWNPISWFKKPVPLSIVVTKKVDQKSETQKITGAEKIITAKIGDVLEMNGIKATVAEVTEDSRCSKGTQCIQAGTVRVRIDARYGFLTKSIVFTLGKSLSYKGHSIMLSAVTPDKVSGITLAPSSYRFTFTHKVVNEEAVTGEDISNEVARQKISSKMSFLGMMRIQGEFFKQENGTYAGLCKSGDAQKNLTSADEGGGSAVCNDDTDSWAASVRIDSNTISCMDSTGRTANIQSSLSSGQTHCVN